MRFFAAEYFFLSVTIGRKIIYDLCVLNFFLSVLRHETSLPYQVSIPIS